MSISYLKNSIKNLRGWSTKRKIIVLESDDWGSIRMPSRQTYEKCLNSGFRVNEIWYEKYDSLASEKDLDILFNTLLSIKDRAGNNPVLTANCVVANPDFEKIKECNFREYHYELITETFKKYPDHSNCFNLWKKGIDLGVFFPQYHGREHLNVSMFMEALGKSDPDALFAFENKMPGSMKRGNDTSGNPYVEATRYSSERDKKEKLKILLDGLDHFEKLFGYKSESFIPQNYFWSPDFDEPVFHKGVRYFQGIRKIYEPATNGKDRYHSHFMGQQNHLGQKYLVRNASFEPSKLSVSRENTVKSCLSEISAAFLMFKPAIITTHRVNYVGFIDEQNRDLSLQNLKELLKTALKIWPDIEFLNSVQLGRLF